ncbi:MAG: PAS domain S-box protein [Cyanophyceae cyanobacterium]
MSQDPPLNQRLAALLNTSPQLMVLPDLPVLTVVAQMQEQGIPWVWVLDPDNGMKVVGSLAGEDGIRLALAGLLQPGIPVVQAMNTSVVQIQVAEVEAHLDNLDSLWDWLQDQKAQAVAVVDESGSLVGTMTRERVQEACWAHYRDLDTQLQAALNFKDGIEKSFPIGVAATDFSGQQIYVNDAFAAMLGWSKAELMGHGPFCYWPEEELETITKALQERLDSKESLKGWELIFCRRTGERFPVRLLTAPWRDGKDNLIGVIASIQDISVEKQIAQQLAGHQYDLELFFRQSLDGIFFMMLDQPITWPQDDVEGQEEILDYVFDHQRITRANQAILNQYGLTEAEFIGSTPRDLFAHDVEYGKWLWKYLFDQGQGHQETNERRQDGSQVWFEGVYICLYDEQGRITGHFGIQRDITEQKRIQQELISSEERLRLATELSETGIWEFAVSDGLSIWSQSHFRLMGLDPQIDAPSYQTWKDRVHPEDIEWVDAAFAKALREQTVLKVEYRLVLPDGSVRWVVNKGQGIYDSAGQPIRMSGVSFDVTERKQAENIQNSLVAAIPDLVGHMSADGTQLQLLSFGTIKSPNPEKDTVRGSHLSEILPPDVYLKRMYFIHQCLQTQSLQIYTQDFELDGKTQYEEVRVVPCDQDSVICIIRDVTQRFEMEEQLSESEEKFRLLAENSTDLVMRHTLEGIHLYVSPSCEQLLGYTPQEMVGHFAYDFFHPEDVKEINSFHQQALPTVEPSIFTYRIRRKDGAYIWFETICKTIWDPESHQPLEIQTSSRDITERMEYQIALQAAEAELIYQVEVRNAALIEALEYESLLRIISDRVRASLNEAEILQMAVEELGQGLDLNRCYVSRFNQDGTRFYAIHEWTDGLSPIRARSYDSIDSIRGQILQGQTLQVCLHQSETDWITVLIVPIWTESEKIYDFISLCRAKESSFLPGETRLAEHVANQCAIGIRQAHLYQGSQTQVTKLQELNQLKEDFIHTISHELRTPLTSMKMALTLIDIHKHDPIRVDTYLSILRLEWNRELNLVNELLELQALESGTSNLNLSSIDLHTWIPELIRPFHLRCQEHHQLLEIDLDASIPAFVTDEYLLGRVLLELLNNACKYTPYQESISLAIQSTEAGILITITNTGVTIDRAHQIKIFEKFHRLPKFDFYNQGGTGLGLALVQKVVELLEGEISLSSANDITTFAIWLPHSTGSLLPPG